MSLGWNRSLLYFLVCGGGTFTFSFRDTLLLVLRSLGVGGSIAAMNFHYGVGGKFFDGVGGFETANVGKTNRMYLNRTSAIYFYL